MRREPESSEVVFDGAVFSVARERWAGADRPYDVAHHLGAAGVLPVTPSADVVLVRQFRPPIRDELLEIPAGLLDVQKEDPIACAGRELVEETGYRHRTIEFLGGVYTTAGFSDEYVHLFWALIHDEPEGEVEAGIEVVHRPFAEMVMAAKAGRVRDAKTALALLLAEARGVVPVG